MKILSIESSCDETAVAIVEDGRKIIKSLVYSQIDMHKEYGGVVPEIASRKHSEIIVSLTKEAMKDIGEIDAVAGTCAPGLIGALLVGANFAKSYAFAKNLPFIPVHHIRGHISANYLAFPDLKPPFLCLVASGGHSLIVEVLDYCDMRIIGGTRDDAAGEAFDKVSRVLGLGYPGGKIIDDLAKLGDKTKYKLPRSKVKDAPLDFSFSGLKTAVINTVHNAKQKGDELDVNSLCASFCEAVVDTLVPRLMLAAQETGHKKLVIAGGVSANSRLREVLDRECEKEGIELFKPPIALCGDNAAMIGAQAYFEFLQGNLGKTNQNCYGSLEISQNVSKMTR
ncbi:MAG: tRNA (adenosine(37)-N6)-threonylcarbamoyltransferase complex transferase subunit TsaD [Clostridia bacterium]